MATTQLPPFFIKPYPLERILYSRQKLDAISSNTNTEESYDDDVPHKPSTQSQQLDGSGPILLFERIKNKSQTPTSIQLIRYKLDKDKRYYRDYIVFSKNAFLYNDYDKLIDRDKIYKVFDSDVLQNFIEKNTLAYIKRIMKKHC